VTTAVYWHPDIFLHDANANHVAMVEDRIKRVFERVSAVPGVELREASPALPDAFRLVHANEFVDHLLAVAPVNEGETYAFDTETVMNRHTLRTLLLSTGAAISAVDAVVDSAVTNAFCAVYAGHHATPEWPQGFCFTNPVAIAARHALNRGVQRLAVIDFDTHSGNGTALCLASESERVLFAETYQGGYPGTVFPKGTPPHILRTKCRNPSDFAHAWRRHLPKIAAFQPEMMLVSAGFDAHMRDPLGVMGLSDTAYPWLANELLAITPKVVAVLEGGYHEEATPRCAALFVSQLVKAAQQRS
jgi:acetoin utilization deacetylase AcuC-like enzyme